MEGSKLQCPCCKKYKEKNQVRTLINQMHPLHPKGFNVDFDWLCRVMSSGYKRWACDDCIKSKKAIISDPKQMNFSVMPKYLAYFNEERTCFDCKKDYIFSAEEQKYWFETLNFWHDAIPNGCKLCRKKIRHQKELVKRLSYLLENLDKNNREALLEIAQIYNEMGKEEKVKHYTALAKKANLKAE